MSPRASLTSLCRWVTSPLFLRSRACWSSILFHIQQAFQGEAGCNVGILEFCCRQVKMMADNCHDCQPIRNFLSNSSPNRSLLLDIRCSRTASSLHRSSSVFFKSNQRGTFPPLKFKFLQSNCSLAPNRAHDFDIIGKSKSD